MSGANCPLGWEARPNEREMSVARTAEALAPKGGRRHLLRDGRWRVPRQISSDVETKTPCSARVWAGGRRSEQTMIQLYTPARKRQRRCRHLAGFARALPGRRRLRNRRPSRQYAQLRPGLVVGRTACSRRKSHAMPPRWPWLQLWPWRRRVRETDPGTAPAPKRARTREWALPCSRRGIARRRAMLLLR